MVIAFYVCFVQERNAKMKKLLVALVAAMFTGVLRADLTVYTEKVDGWVWQYEIAEGKAQNVVGQFTSKYTGPGPHLVIPAKLGGKAVASLGLYALQGHNFTTVTIPSTVTRIGNFAFRYCSNLKSVKLPDSVKEVSINAFESCVHLQCVDFGKNVSFIGLEAFKGCGSLRSLVFRGANAPNVAVDQHTGAPSSFDGVAEGCTVYVPAKAKGWPTDKQWQGMPLVPGDCMVDVNVDVYDGGGKYGTVSGGGQFAVGAKITLKGTPNKGCLCAGWQDDETGVYYGHSATLSYVVTGADTDFRTGFVQSNETDDYLYVNSLYSQYDADDDGTVYVPVGVSSLSEPNVTVKGLPSGVKFDAAKMVLTGRATKPGAYHITVSATNKSIKNPKTAEFDINVSDFKDESIPVEGFYGAFTPGVIYVETIAAAAGCKVTGLPSGMKWTDKDIYKKGSKTEVDVPANSVYGAPTTPGFYTVFFTKTDANKVKHTATATFSVGPFKTLEVVMVGNSGKDKVTGDGEYAAHKKVTLKATADKGKVFGGWYFDSACTDLVSLSPSFPFEMPEIGEVRFYAKFITLEEEVAGVSALLDSTFLFGAGGATSHAATVSAGVYLEWPLVLNSPTLTQAAVSGLPAGLKFTAKDIMKKGSKTEVEIPANTIYGAPTAASKTDKNTNALIPFNVKITLTTAGKAKLVYDLALTVKPLPTWMVGTYDGGDNNGQSSLTVAATGKVSGKYLTDGETWTLSATCFDPGVEDKIYYLATLAGKAGTETDTFALYLYDYETGGYAELRDGYGQKVATLWKTSWNEEPWKTVAQLFAKADSYSYVQKYTEEYLGQVVLRFASSGKVTVGATFVTGKDAKNNEIVYKASGSAVVIPTTLPDGNGAFNAKVFVYLPPKAGKFEGHSKEVSLRWDGTAFELLKE